MSGELGREEGEKPPEVEISAPGENIGINSEAEVQQPQADSGIATQGETATSPADSGISQLETKNIETSYTGIEGEADLSEAGDWQTCQADHAWDGHKAEFEKIGIENASDLKTHFDEVRQSPDYEAQLPRDRQAYGKVDNGAEGTILIDNPNAENGGTGFRTENVEERMDELRRRP